MSFVAELKQRKVFRVATVYLVVAWVAIQAASIALPAFEAPPWALRVVILLFALGFPLALLLTWAVDLTPDGIRVASGNVGNKRMAAIAAGLMALAVAWYFIGQPALRTQAAAAERSIAVLPFVNMSGDKANEYFSDGLAETTLDMLAQVKDLKVIARTSSFAFKGKAADVRQIGKALDAAHLLEGSVQQAGDTVRITVQLIRTRDGVHLWSQRYDRKLADVFRIQDEIATEVVKALQVALPAAEQQRLLRKRTDNVAAYDEYLKGMALLPGRKVADMRRAVRHFERAIELDPTYARAYAAAGTTYYLFTSYAGADAQEMRRANAHIQRALELAPDLGEAHIAHAALLEHSGELEGADKAFRRGLELAPGYATGHQWYGEFLGFVVGEPQRALPLYQRALLLDPLSPIVRHMHAVALAAAGREQDSLQANARLIADQPDFAPAYQLRAEMLELQGDLPGALRAWNEHARVDPHAVGPNAGRCLALVRYGVFDEARACLAAPARAAPEHRFVVEAQARLASATGAFADGLAQIADSHNDWATGWLLLLEGRHDEAADAFRTVDPGLFAQPPVLTSRFPADAIVAGAILLGQGETARGRDLLQRGLRANAATPIVGYGFGRGWWDAVAHALLGDLPAACRALQEAVDAGHVLGIEELDHAPLLAALRADPCYARILAPARAKVAAQVDAARAAGLLSPAPAR